MSFFSSAINDKTKRVRRQILLEIQNKSKTIDHVFFVSQQLATPLLTGTDFCILLEAMIGFWRKKVTLTVDRQRKTDFVYKMTGATARDGEPSDRDSSQTENSVYSLDRPTCTIMTLQGWTLPYAQPNWQIDRSSVSAPWVKICIGVMESLM